MRDTVGPFIVGVVLILAVAFGIPAVYKSNLRSACAVFAQESGRETKFVDYSFLSADCLTPVEDGKWISAMNLRDK